MEMTVPRIPPHQLHHTENAKQAYQGFRIYVHGATRHPGAGVVPRVDTGTIDRLDIHL